jgi:hypothetical protein
VIFVEFGKKRPGVREGRRMKIFHTLFGCEERIISQEVVEIIYIKSKQKYGT